MLRSAFAFIAAPFVGVLAGGVAMSVVVPGPAAMFSLMYVLFGGFIACIATLIVGLPLVVALRRTARPLLPWLLPASFITGLVSLVGFQCILSAGGCSIGPVHNAIFGLVSSVVTAVVLNLLLPRHYAL